MALPLLLYRAQPPARTLDPPGVLQPLLEWVAKNYSFGRFDLNLATLA